jgi:hypothetical protein
MTIAEPVRAADFLSILNVWFEVIACPPPNHAIVSPSASAAASEPRTEPASTVESALILGSGRLCGVTRFGRLVYTIVPRALWVHMAEAQAHAQRGRASVREAGRRPVSCTSAQVCQDSGSWYLLSYLTALWVHMAETQALAQRGWAGVHETGRRPVSCTLAQAGRYRSIMVGWKQAASVGYPGPQAQPSATSA